MCQFGGLGVWFGRLSPQLLLVSNNYPSSLPVSRKLPYDQQNLLKTTVYRKKNKDDLSVRTHHLVWHPVTCKVKCSSWPRETLAGSSKNKSMVKRKNANVARVMFLFRQELEGRAHAFRGVNMRYTVELRYDSRSNCTIDWRVVMTKAFC